MEEVNCSICQEHICYMNDCGPCGMHFCDSCAEELEQQEESEEDK